MWETHTIQKPKLRKVPPGEIKQRVTEVAGILGLQARLKQRLFVDKKQPMPLLHGQKPEESEWINSYRVQI